MRFRKINKALSVAIILVTAFSFTACSKGNANATANNESTDSDTSADINSSSGNQEQITIKLVTTSPASEFAEGGSTALGVSANYFMDEIESRSNGRIKVQFFPDGQLASSVDDHFSGLLNGAFDMMILNNGSWADYTSAFAGLNIPYL